MSRSRRGTAGVGMDGGRMRGRLVPVFVQNKGNTDALAARARIGNHHGEALDLAGQHRRGIDADDGVADLGAVGVQQGDADRRRDPFIVTDIPEGTRDQHLARVGRHRSGADRLEIQSGRVHGQADGGIGGSRAGGHLDHLDAEQPGGGEQGGKSGSDAGPDHAMGRRATQAALLFGPGAEGLGQFGSWSLGQ